MKILIVDDQRSARHVLRGIVEPLDVEVLEAASYDDAVRVLADELIEVALVDVHLSVTDARNQDGLRLVEHMRQRTATVPIVVTVSHEMSLIREAMRRGAFDYILKDDLCEELVLPVIAQLRDRQRLQREVTELRARVNRPAPSALIGTSRPIEQLRAVIDRVVVSDRPVLVVGPTGSGKELVVSDIHARGPKPEAPLLDLNCGAIPEALIEAQLFGHERGAFTGADRKQEGYFAAVRDGTLFLDEIAELPLTLQAKLLRVIETGRFRPVGSTAEQRFAGRIVAATHADLERRVAEKTFREDLLYRLNVLAVRVPSLDERRDDIPLLVAHFAQQQRRQLRFSPDAMQALVHRSWPGNVRQLRNVVDRLAVFADSDEITAGVLDTISPGDGQMPAAAGEGLRELMRAVLRLPLEQKLAAVEQALLDEALVLADGNKTAAARLLGVHRKVIERRLDRG